MAKKRFGLIVLAMVSGAVLSGCETRCDHSCVALGNEPSWDSSTSCYEAGGDVCVSSCKAMKNWDKRDGGTTYRCDCP
jgi:hypothetical protein